MTQTDGNAAPQDRTSRRAFLQQTGLGLGGIALTDLLSKESVAADRAMQPRSSEYTGRAKNVIYVWLQGGPPQHETFDPKPGAPQEIRGPFQPIQTNVPGIEFCELLPRTARIADKLAVVRSMHTDSDIHDVSGYELLTGYKSRGANSRMISPEDWPYFGSIVKMLKPSESHACAKHSSPNYSVMPPRPRSTRPSMRFRKSSTSHSWVCKAMRWSPQA